MLRHRGIYGWFMSLSCSTVKLQLMGNARYTSFKKATWPSAIFVRRRGLRQRRDVSDIPDDSWRMTTVRISSVLISLPQPRQNASVSAAMAAENLATQVLDTAGLVDIPCGTNLRHIHRFQSHTNAPWVEAAFVLRCLA